jgi:AcrR family transcriptional regulator
LTLREVAAEVGMQAPSLYSHFGSKHDIYDAMFADAWGTYLARVTEEAPRLPRRPRARLRAMARHYVDFACADLARHQIMDVRTVPDFAPSEQSYAVSLECYERFRAEFAALGITSGAHLDMWTALLAGVISQQLANDPGGTRWLRLLPRLVDMYCDAVGIGPDPTGRSATRPTAKESQR